ncbi:hypothetical protein GCM10008924_11870 [Gracilibacillus halotolerans]
MFIVTTRAIKAIISVPKDSIVMILSYTLNGIPPLSRVYRLYPIRTLSNFIIA